ncbi:MAG: NusG domain II-containing protein [Firmicutes bacterium]|nr:NusG domain II-containing protein [Bacillota bacterium]
MKNIIKKADIILFLFLILLGIVLTVASLVGGSDTNTVVVKVDGKVYGTYSISKDQTIKIEKDDHYNLIEIKDGKVKMAESNCHNQLCVKQGAISSGNMPIVCLPNRVIVNISGEEDDIDVITR